MKVSAKIVQIKKNPFFKLIFYSYKMSITFALIFIISLFTPLFILLLRLPLLGYMEIWPISMLTSLTLGFVFSMINLEIEKRIKYFDYVGTITFDSVKWLMTIHLEKQDEKMYDLYEIKNFNMKIKSYTHRASWGSKLEAYFNGVNNYVEFEHENERYKYYFHLDDDKIYYNFIIIRDLLFPVIKKI
jgi:hypothetical protein